MTDHRTFTTLDEALRAQRIPLENWSLIRAITRSIGISHYEERSSYLKTIRRDGGRALRIHSGWTEGLESEEEAAPFRDFENSSNEVWSDESSWVVGHPLNQIRGSAGSRASPSPEPEICTHCFMTLPRSGTCDCQGEPAES